MSEASGFGDFGKWVPGFEFLQSLTRPAAAPSAGPAAWVAPTLSEEEIDKRVQELKAVLFWLEQNATALKATIQALEVQKMTLSALKGMNVSRPRRQRLMPSPSLLRRARQSRVVRLRRLPRPPPGWSIRCNGGAP
jgi:hypothetical protein